MWEQSHIAPGIYIVNHAHVIKFIKITTNLKHRAGRKQEYETVVFQKNRYKILKYVNPFEQNNDHTRISLENEEIMLKTGNFQRTCVCEEDQYSKLYQKS